MNSNDAADNLFNLSPINYEQHDDKYLDHLLEQYKLSVEMADKVSDRRGTANTFFLSLNSFLLTILGVLPQLKSNIIEFTIIWIIIVSVAGITFSVAWIVLINGYAKLNWAKFKVINKIEEKLPVTMYKTEWDYLEKAEIKVFHITRTYSALSKTEIWIPRIIIFLYIALASGAMLVSAGIIKFPFVPSG